MTISQWKAGGVICQLKFLYLSFKIPLSLLAPKSILSSLASAKYLIPILTGRGGHGLI